MIAATSSRASPVVTTSADETEAVFAATPDSGEISLADSKTAVKSVSDPNVAKAVTALVDAGRLVELRRQRERSRSLAGAEGGGEVLEGGVEVATRDDRLVSDFRGSGFEFGLHQHDDR